MTTAQVSKQPRMATVAAYLCILSVALPGTIRANEWQVIKEHDGIIVSQRIAESLNFPQLRSVGEVQGTPQEVLAILQDVPAHVHWRPDCVESRVVRRIDTLSSVVYTRTNIPWPASDREVVLRNRVTYTESPLTVKLQFKSIDAPDVERTRGTVRMPTVNGYYLIEAVDDERTTVTYELTADPGGKLPDWLVARQSVKNPLETLTGLRRRLVETRGLYDEEIAKFAQQP